MKHTASTKTTDAGSNRRDVILCLYLPAGVRTAIDQSIQIEGKRTASGIPPFMSEWVRLVMLQSLNGWDWGREAYLPRNRQDLKLYRFRVSAKELADMDAAAQATRKEYVGSSVLERGRTDIPTGRAARWLEEQIGRAAHHLTNVAHFDGTPLPERRPVRRLVRPEATAD